MKSYLKNKRINYNYLLLFLIVVVACVLRFYDYGNSSISHDEFSALFRTNYDSFSKEIQKGIIEDVHPPLIQLLLYYWTMSFGWSAYSIKLPFILFGIGSVIVAFFIGKKWYSQTAGLIVACFIASMEYTIMYSQTARPYSSGMFFALMMVYFWTNIVQKPQEKYIKNAIFFVVFACLCSYNHHFSLLIAFIVGVSGLFVIDKKFIKKYILTCLCVIVLYLPNIPILLAQMKMKGAGGWLGKPNKDFLIQYVEYLFHYSIAVYLVAFGLFIYSIIKTNDFKKYKKIYFIMLSWFFVPFAIGFIYSYLVDAVLQFSSLIFGVSFLLFALFGLIKEQKTIVNLIIVVVILIVNITTLITTRQYYDLFYKSIYTKTITDREDAKKTYSKITTIMSCDKNITTYYLNKFNLHSSFINLNDIKDGRTLANILKQEQNKNDYLYLGEFAYENPVFVQIIKDYFPYIVNNNDYYAGNTFVFSKINKKEYIQKTKDFDSVLYFSPKIISIKENQQYSSAISFPLKQIMNNRNNFIDVSASVYCCGYDTNSVLAIELDKRNKSFYWTCTPLKDYVSKEDTNKWVKIYLSLKLSDVNLNHRKITFKVYFANDNKHKFFYKNLTIKRRTGNKVVYKMLER